MGIYVITPHYTFFYLSKCQIRVLTLPALFLPVFCVCTCNLINTVSEV